MKPEILHQFPNPVFILSGDISNFEILFKNKAAEDCSPAWNNLKEKLKDVDPDNATDIEIECHGTWYKTHISRTSWEDKPALILILNDISEYKNALQKADAVSEMKSNFLATMSHEIRTPMQSIYGFLELMNASTTDADLLGMISTSKSSASGLLEILDDILDLAKVDAGKMELDEFEIPIRTLARGLLEGLAIKVQGKDVKLIDEISDDVPFVLKGDPKRLRQIVLNLVGNSIKFTDKGSVTLRLSTKAQKLAKPRDGFILRCEIIDTGIGMSKEVAGRLFKPFSQADNTTTRVFGGTGLGLSISKKLVELMGGVIGVDSFLGQGSTFWFEIPTKEITESIVVELPNLEGITVLSVEDHPRGAQEIVNSLRSMGAEVSSTPSYDEGLEWIKSKPFDVAVIDYGLPGHKTGLDLIKEINKLRPFTGLVMYTVHDDMQIQHDIKTIGGTFLSKPASRLGLGQAVKDASKQTNHIRFDGPKKLLVAEDTDSVRDVLSRQFKLLGVDAEFVDNGEKALAALETGKYGLCITDLHMPKVDGYQLIDKVRNHSNPNLKMMPVMVITADVQLAHRQSFLAFGFNECLLKPVSIGQLKRLFIRWGLLTEEEQTITPPTQNAPTSQISAAPAVERPFSIDIEGMKHLMGSFDESSIEMLHMFVDMSRPLIEQLGKAVEAQDRHKSKEVAHSLKGAARSACCPKLGDVCAKMQEDIERGGSPDKDLYAKIKAEFDYVCEDVKQLKVS